MASKTVCVPMKVDAFVLNQTVADDADVKIGPITQPNYTFLRLDGQNIQSDILDPVDLHYTHPRQNNSRVTDFSTGSPLSKRFGVYLSWILPRAYRTGVAASSDPDAAKRAQAHGISPGTDRPTDFDPDLSAPNFRAIPTRWLVVRHIDSPDPRFQCRSWIVESDRQWDLDELDETTDLQVDVSPFIAPSKDNIASDVEQQAEVFIGHRVDHVASWTEDDPHSPTKPKRIKPMTLLNASNPLFPDFQPHNTNVFSMLDDFTYVDNGVAKVMAASKASYYVIGWHADPTEDPFHLDPDPSLAMLLKDRLSALKMSISGSSDDVKNWMKATTSSNAVCHGAIYDVQWTPDAPPTPVLGKAAATALTSNGSNVPISVGTTATDALLTYIAAFEKSETDETIQKLETDLWALRTLLLAQDDGVDKQLEATDMLYNYGFDGSDGGGDWHRSGGNDGTEPKADQLENLKSLFRTQAMLDAATRTLRFLQWQLFSVWWRWVSAANGDPLDKTIAPEVKAAQVDPLVKRMAALVGSSTSPPQQNTINWLQSEVTRLSGLLPVQKGAKPPFYTQKDPTMMIGGVKSAWPSDFLDDLAVRLESQVISKNLTAPSGPNWNLFDTPTDISGLVQMVVSKLPPAVRNAGTLLLREFAGLQSGNPQLADDEYAPLYHDTGPKTTVPSADPPPPPEWRDRWHGQPWFPLFVEWEAQYFHIPFDQWVLDERDAAGPIGVHKLLQYRIRSDVHLEGSTRDMRTAFGRMVLLPQPNFSLKVAVTQLLQNMSDADLKAQGLGPGERTTILQNIDRLPYLSHPLNGLTDHLTTRSQGTHIKPARRPPGGKLSAMPAAIAASSAIGIREDAIIAQDNSTHVTPYGRSVGALLSSSSPQHPAFKPVTHGQLRMTKLNIIDKFGQAVCAIDPTPSANPPRIAPAVADVYVCQPDTGPGGGPNVVQRDPSIKPPACEFVQLTPSINQAARLNSATVISDGVGGWRPAYDWEFPGGLWGWVVVNYAEYALQLFLPEGTFYREVRLGGTGGTTTSPPWSPFRKPDAPSDPSQLDQLIQALGDRTYLTAFFDMIVQAQSLLPPAPNSYAQYLNTIIGKPFALVNMGWSLELATPPLQNESVKNTVPVDRTLLPLDTAVLPTGLGPGNAPPPQGTPQYSFSLKLGDRDRVYDGLVGYWKAATSGSGFDISTLYTYWTSDEGPSTTTTTTAAAGMPPPPPENAHTVQPSTPNYPKLYPFHVSPDALTNPPGTTPPPPALPTDTAPIAPTAYETTWNSHLVPVAAVVDPFTAVHGYTGVLPTGALKVPEWLLERAMRRMTAFFRMGPVVVTKPVPAYKSDHVVQATDPPGTNTFVDAIDLPAVAVGQWEWLQPYDQPVKGRGGGGAGELVPPPYMSLGLSKVDAKPRFEDPPYIAVEGFLRLKQPIIKPQI